MLKPGQMAPDIELYNENNNAVSLKSLYQSEALVLFFYPKDFSPGCTKQVCMFRDAHQEFKEYGARVIGISSDSQSSHEKFQQKHNLQYELFKDEGGEAAKAFGVGKTFGLLPGRITFVIDKTGLCRLSFSSQIKLEKHISHALDIVKAINEDA